MTLGEFLGYVKKFHPIVKQADLVVADSDLKRLKARGVFDPKLEIDYSNKEFKSKEYYNKLNAAFKIPVWYGVNVKASYEDNQGYYLNPENTTPDSGLYGLGLTASIGSGMFMNERMAAVKQAKNYQKQALEERKILVNTILFDAANTYFNWLQYYKEKKIHESFLTNATIRFKAVKRNFEAGEEAAIDTLEANITISNRKLNLEKAKIKYTKSSLLLSNYLWLENNIPVELNQFIAPDTLTIDKVDVALQTPLLQVDNFQIKDHPKLRALSFKFKNLEIDRKLKFNKLLPKIEAQYNFLSESFGDNSSLGFENYKAGLKVSMPIFLRKERADLKLAKIKLQALNYERSTQETSISNKIIALQRELASYEKQMNFAFVLVRDYKRMSEAEFRKFILGESSVFYVNIRESKLIEAELKYVELLNNYLKTKAKLFNSLAIY
jgi:outer membrane protein TolC